MNAELTIDTARCHCCAVYTATFDLVPLSTCWGNATVCKQCIRAARRELHKPGTPHVTVTSGRTWKHHRIATPSTQHHLEAAESLCVLRCLERACGFDWRTGKPLGA